MLGRGTVTIIMRMNRRNVLVGLGTIVAGGGAALGTGAFSSVEADRTVTVSTSGDSSAYIGISVDGSYATDNGGGDAVEVNLGDSYNDSATTRINGVLTLENNAADSGDVLVSLGDSSAHDNSTTIGVDDVAEVTFELSTTDTGESYYTLTTENSVAIDVTVDTTIDSPGTDDSISLYAESA
ncbi:hypothetical protein CP556_09265 [Natrinema sp. CBA1119]|uniref:hypothetical protein n=1 Tax=Natrinema sp. CBA1119 TaxID=1608465 RepID=UPI000BF64083|nr:hypothetical protein [Natrinema sp. CBA1119]PGF16286.1 hypothetical protein CP556_09265 [Natrinema sp. CBA1119]